MQQKKTCEFYRIERRPEAYAESAADYSLPDYNSDVRKILFTDAEVRPASKFVGDGELELSGIVVYTVVYSDNEGRLESVSFTSDYDLTSKCNTEGLEEVVFDTRVQNFAIRPIGPRRISARCSLASSITLSYKEGCEIDGDVFSGEEEPELLRGKMNYERECATQTLEREYAEPIVRLDGAIADEVSVIFSDAEVKINELTDAEDTIAVSGEILLSAVIKSYEEPARLYTKTLSFSETLQTPDKKEGAVYFPTATVTSLRVNVNAEETGSEVVADFIVELGAVCKYNESVEYVKDAYLKSRATENGYTKISSGELLYASRESESFAAELPRADILEDGIREIVFLKASPRLNSIDTGEGSMTLSGEIKYTGVASALSEDGEPSYSAVKFTVPYTRTVSVLKGRENMKADAKIKAGAVGVTVDAGTVYVSCELECSATAVGYSEYTLLSSSNTCEGEKFGGRSEIVVYYPEAGESLYSVAKKFHTSESKIALDNALSATASADGTEGYSLSGTERLMIF